MALMYAKYPHPEPIERAVKLVMSRQLPVRLLLHVSPNLRLIEFLGWLMGSRGHRGRVQ
jgi:hypothetical protein